MMKAYVFSRNSLSSIHRLVSSKYSLTLKSDMAVVDLSSTGFQDSVNLAVESLKLGNIVAVPTDTIYGIAGLVQHSDAISSIYNLKNRDYSKPVAISVADVDDIYRWAHVTVEKSLLSNLLPGPVTLVFNRTTELNPALNPGTSLIGVRIPDHNFIRAISRSCQGPIALTSANISAARSTLCVEEFEDLWPKLSLVFNGGVLGDTEQSRKGSTVVDLSVVGKYKIIRDGSALKSTVLTLESYGIEKADS